MFKSTCSIPKRFDSWPCDCTRGFHEKVWISKVVCLGYSRDTSAAYSHYPGALSLTWFSGEALFVQSQMGLSYHRLQMRLGRKKPLAGTQGTLTEPYGTMGQGARLHF